MACLPTIRHPVWRTLPMRMSITPLLYPLRANNPKLVMHMSLKPWGRHMKVVATYPFAGERGEAHGCVFQRRKMCGVANNV